MVGDRQEKAAFFLYHSQHETEPSVSSFVYLVKPNWIMLENQTCLLSIPVSLPLSLSLWRLLVRNYLMLPRRIRGQWVQHWLVDEVSDTCGDKKHPSLFPFPSVLNTCDSANFRQKFFTKISSKWYSNYCDCHFTESQGRPDVCWFKMRSPRRNGE